MEHGQHFFRVLLLLGGLFVLRVLAQLLQAIRPVSALPPFEEWHSGVMSYPVLLSVQVLIVVFVAAVFWRVRMRSMSPRR